MGFAFPEESWDWEFCEEPFGCIEGKVAMIEDEQCARSFYDEGAGQPSVSPEELAWLDAEAVQLELDRLRQLDAIGTVFADVDVEQCVKLETLLVRDWRFRGKWRRRARLVAREFRDGDCSSAETFSPTTPLAVVKMLIVLSCMDWQ